MDPDPTRDSRKLESYTILRLTVFPENGSWSYMESHRDYNPAVNSAFKNISLESFIILLTDCLPWKWILILFGLWIQLWILVSEYSSRKIKYFINNQRYVFFYIYFLDLKSLIMTIYEKKAAWNRKICILSIVRAYCNGNTSISLPCIWEISYLCESVTEVNTF